MIVVHHLETSRPQRALWLLEELGAPYEVKRYDRSPSFAGTAMTAALAKGGLSQLMR